MHTYGHVNITKVSHTIIVSVTHYHEISTFQPTMHFHFDEKPNFCDIFLSKGSYIVYSLISK